MANFHFPKLGCNLGSFPSEIGNRAPGLEGKERLEKEADLSRWAGGSVRQVGPRTRPLET